MKAVNVPNLSNYALYLRPMIFEFFKTIFLTPWDPISKIDGSEDKILSSENVLENNLIRHSIDDKISTFSKAILKCFIIYPSFFSIVKKQKIKGPILALYQNSLDFFWTFFKFIFEGSRSDFRLGRPKVPSELIILF